MTNEHILYIPRRAKIVITALAIFFFLLSIAVVLVLLNEKADAGVVTTGLTLAQTCAAGLGVIAIVFYTRFNVNVSFLKKRTEDFLIREIPDALRIVDYKDSLFTELTRAYRPNPLVTKTRIMANYDHGNHYCQYRVLAYGVEQKIYVQVNVKRFVVSYFLDADLAGEADIRQRLNYVVAAAEAAGYSYKYEDVHDTAHGSVSAQLRLFKTLPDDFLVNASERLFLANDFASMTRALIRALPGCVVDLPIKSDVTETDEVA
ncbi:MULTISPECIES: hypothetical protein [Agrobacterium]|uniref:Uncharacterized protein n=1 Tax=Agrobacterium tumefaciens TaxID=358 RepID=A0AAE6BEE6_AGRTU|nr:MULTISPECIES: hypothetical protein [Agrobacterium]QCL73908.1 hypothetical protein CFBP5499_11140 [Agrobacterium tumefaciens]QCL79484.1 hypothetical protein CFBP5877_10670 [Agrobacterium tumefaciens]CUX35252.1 exported hypothetical protein [Agrobacterium sp. NCPPB 925]